MLRLPLWVQRRRNSVTICLAAVLCALVCLAPAVFPAFLSRYMVLGLPLDQALALPLGGIVLTLVVFLFARRMDRLANDEPFED